MQKFILKNKITILLSLIVIIIFTIFFITYIEDNNNQEKISTIAIPINEIKETKKITTDKTETTSKPLLLNNTQNITIIAGEEKIKLSATADTLLYNALIQAKNDGIFKFSGKNYPGLGFFVTEIGTLQAGDGKNLFYYINGKKATVGVSSYLLKDNDVIEWKLE